MTVSDQGQKLTVNMGGGRGIKWGGEQMVERNEEMREFLVLDEDGPKGSLRV